MKKRKAVFLTLSDEEQLFLDEHPEINFSGLIRGLFADYVKKGHSDERG